MMRWEMLTSPLDNINRTVVDDEVDVLIDGVKIQTAKIRPKERRNDPTIYQAFNATSGKKSIEQD